MHAAVQAISSSKIGSGVLVATPQYSRTVPGEVGDILPISTTHAFLPRLTVSIFHHLAVRSVPLIILEISPLVLWRLAASVSSTGLAAGFSTCVRLLVVVGGFGRVTTQLVAFVALDNKLV